MIFLTGDTHIPPNKYEQIIGALKSGEKPPSPCVVLGDCGDGLRPVNGEVPPKKYVWGRPTKKVLKVVPDETTRCGCLVLMKLVEISVPLDYENDIEHTLKMMGVLKR